MKWKILHESKGRMRLHLNKPRMSLAEADQLQDYLAALPGVRTAAVYERTCDVVVVYTENRASLVKGLAAFRFDVEEMCIRDRSWVKAQVSGLWQYWQRMAQPCIKIIYRTPGPSTRPKVSTEWM